MPARVSRSQASASSLVISLGWLTWMFSHSGWYFCSMSHNSAVTRMGMKTGTREPMRMISMCGISRRRLSSSSSSLGASTSGSPPESSTSRTCGVRLEVVDLQLEFGAGEGGAGVADDARAGAVAAVGGALGRDQHQHPVGVAVHQARARASGGLRPASLPSCR